MTDKKEIGRHFGADLLSSKILPVYIRAENKSSTSFVVSKEWISIETGKTSPTGSPVRERVGSQADRAASQAYGGATALMVLGVITMPLGMVVFWPIGNKMSSDGDEIRYNFAVNELQTVTLSPGEAAVGFVYFDLPEGQEISAQWPIHIRVHDLTSGEVKKFEFLFQWAKERNQA
jgi:hypothetical protein